MASTLKASSVGLELVDRARRQKGWNKAELKWQLAAEVSKSSLDRFWEGKGIKQQNFVKICAAVGIDDWEQVADLPPIAPVTVKRSSNLAQVNEPVIVELEGFAQQIFDWFGALSFEFEGLPRREGNYAEWVIRVPVRRSRFDRVLIRAIIHEAGLNDLDGLRRSVADLRVDEGWLVTSLWVSPAVKQVLNRSDEKGLTCLTFDELIDQDANFSPYLAWLEAEIRRRELEKYYVPLGCTKGEFDGGTRTLRGISSYPVSEGGIDLYIDRWLENLMNEHVSILGEFGTGKTWFVLHYAGRCLRAYVEAKQKGMPRPRLPLVIPLRDYAKALNVENVLAGFFYTQHNIRLNSAVFDRLNRMGKLLLIFDGFDEMADKIDQQKMIDNFWELAKVVTPNAKVILTCRTEHFPTAQVGLDTLRGELLASTAMLTGVPPQFETLELMKFDDDQIREVLGRRTDEVTVGKVMGNGQVLDLLRRAVMGEFVLAALPEIEAGKEIDLARVYLYAVRRQMEENITTGRTFTSLADKLYFLCELSWEMLSTDRMSLNYREFPELLKRFFGREVESQKDLDHWHYDMMGQTMLVRNDDGDYSPAHRSLLEFFVAYKLAAEMGFLADDFLMVAQKQSRIDDTLEPHFYTWSSYWQRKLDKDFERELISPLVGFISESTENLRNTFGKYPLTQTVLDLNFIMLNKKTDNKINIFLLDLVYHTKRKTVKQIGYLGGNAATILVRIDPNALDHKNLNEVNLCNANLLNAGLRNTSLVGANLSDCLITRAFGSVNSIIMSCGDNQFFTGHYDNTIRIWDRASGVELQRLVGHQGSINCLALSKDSKLVYSGSDDHTIKEWRINDGICQRTFEGHQEWVTSIVLSDDDKFLYSGSNDSTIKQWNLNDGICQQTFKGHKDWITSIILSENSHFLYSASNDCTIREWNINNGVCQREFKGHKNWVRDIVLSNDGKFLYSGSGDHTIKKWMIADGICQYTFRGHQDSVRAITLSIDGLLLYSGSNDSVIKEWEVNNGICQRTFKGHQNWIRAIILSCDGKFLYSGSGDRTIKEWDLANGICQRTIEGYQNWVRAITLNSDEKLLYFGGGDNTIQEWDLVGGFCKRTFEGYQNSYMAIILSPDGKFLYSGSDEGTIREWNLADGTCHRTFKGHKNWVRTIVISNDGQFLYSGSNDGTMIEWRLSDGICHRTFEGHKNSVRTISLSIDGRLLYSGSVDRSIKEWNLSNGICQRTFEGHEDSVISIILSNDREFLYSGSDDSTIKQWNLIDGSCKHTFTGHKNWIIAIALSKDGKFLYSGSGDHTIKKWQTDNGHCQYTFIGHQNWVSAIILSADDYLLYSGGGDGMIKIWNAITGECVTTIDQRLCANANITNVKGLTPAQTDTLIALGAFDENRK